MLHREVDGHLLLTTDSNLHEIIPGFEELSYRPPWLAHSVVPLGYDHDDTE